MEGQKKQIENALILEEFEQEGNRPTITYSKGKFFISGNSDWTRNSLMFFFFFKFS